ncbi:MAG TPA: HAMP domain-containing sensor histidine kinase [Kofleriaceae bacterium]|nr:HAMP domain-containing sensor histidine kinase [Kofleriaceae bacterium]
MKRSLDDLRAELDFSAADEQRIRALAPILEPHFSEIASLVVKRVAIGYADSSHAPSIDWMRSSLEGPWDVAFYKERAVRAKQLVDRNISATTIVAVIHVVRSSYVKALTTANRTNEDVFSIHKLLDLELAMMLHAHELESERQLMIRERRWQTDQREAMQTLSTGFAHELRNPLNSARLQLDVLERRIRRYIEDPAVAEPAFLARQEIERLCDLVEDFLAFAQPPALTPSMADLVTLVEHVVEVEQTFAYEHGVELSLIAPDVRWHARVDADKVRQVVKNLVRNGIEAAPKGGHVEIRFAGVDGHVHIQVHDDGPGIPDKVRSRMFEPFFSTKDTGTGLGMSIVQSIVQMHGGTIDVDTGSAGTTVDVALPRAS